MEFNSPSDTKKRTLDEVIQEFYIELENNSDAEYKLIVGSDSQRHGKKTRYVSVVLLHRVGKGARFFFSREVIGHNNRIDLSVRLMHETERTCNILKAVEQSIIFNRIGRENIEAHVDASQNGSSRKILDSCVGWLESFGWNTVHKPDAFVATKVADRMTR